MLRLSGVRKTFGSVVAVDDLSLDIRPGEVFGLLGPNGAGKTTTIRMAVGQLRPDAGQIEFDGGGSPADPQVRRRIGVAPQALALYDELTGEENLTFFGRLYGLHGRDLQQRVAQLLDFTGLTERRRSRVSTYSGGMKRRLNFAVALVHAPALVLLDEPTAGVDPQSRNAIFDFVQRLKGDGRTIVYTTHYMEEAQRLCDRVAIMDHGHLLALDTISGLLAQYGRRSVVVVERAAGAQRTETDDPKTELMHALQDATVLRARVEQADLESVFLSLTGRSLRD